MCVSNFVYNVTNIITGISNIIILYTEDSRFATYLEITSESLYACVFGPADYFQRVALSNVSFYLHQLTRVNLERRPASKFPPRNRSHLLRGVLT